MSSPTPPSRAPHATSAIRGLLICAGCLAGLLLAPAAAPGQGATPVESVDPAEAADPPGDPFDPLEGMDENGRIPAVERPADLPNPERWRYIPEGRLKPGNLLQRLFVSSVIGPFIFHSEDVGTGGGMAIIDLDFRGQRRQEFAGAFVSYTTEGQQNYSFVWRRWLHHLERPGGGVLQEERSFIRAAGGYSRTLTRRFFGLGSKTRESGESSYTDEMFDLQLGFERAVPDPGDDLVVGLGVRAEFHELMRGHVKDEPDTKDAFPGLFRDADGTDLGWLQASVRWDTRDSQRNPYKGFSIGADLDAALVQTGGEVGARYTLRGSKVFAVPSLIHGGGDANEENPPTDSLAFGLRTQLTSGRLPFFSLPALGGSDDHRGFIAGRFRGDASWIGSVEHRLWLIPRGFALTKAIRVERIGLAFFYELGAVGDNGIDLFESHVRHSYGLGVRATLERHAPFRVDIGFSEDGINIAAGFGLSF